MQFVGIKFVSVGQQMNVADIVFPLVQKLISLFSHASPYSVVLGDIPSDCPIPDGSSSQAENRQLWIRFGESIYRVVHIRYAPIVNSPDTQ